MPPCHTQFIPTTYNSYAVDFDGDGKRDLWNSIADALASTANYLKASGWREGETWGYEVVLPKGFNFAHSGRRNLKTVEQWSLLGIRRSRGRHFPRPRDRAALILPAGARGPAFLILANFRAILKYNQSTSYALAIGHLADRMHRDKPFAQSWPREDKPLARSERVELQKLLIAAGYGTGGTDGIIGVQTRRALRSYQRARGLAEDGYASVGLLKRLRAENKPSSL